MKRYGPPEQSDFIFVPHSEENPHNHPPNIETAEVIDIRNEAKNEGLVNKFKPAKRICEEKLLQLQGNWNLFIIISFFEPFIDFF